MGNEIKESEELGKVIHKVNTSLSIIWGYVQLLEQNEEVDDKSKNWILKISNECKNLKDLLDSFRK